MEPIIEVTSKAIPLTGNNIDTDQLLPKQFLTEISRTGFGKHLLHDQRYLDDKEQVPNPECVLNNDAYKGAKILLAGENFGCGSSREHAPWAIADFGISVIIAKGFADIFYANCLNNQLLPVCLSASVVDLLMRKCSDDPSAEITVSLKHQRVVCGDITATFTIPAHHRVNLMNGVDKIGRTLQDLAVIEAYEANYHVTSSV